MSTSQGIGETGHQSFYPRSAPRFCSMGSQEGEFATHMGSGAASRRAFVSYAVRDHKGRPVTSGGCSRHWQAYIAIKYRASLYADDLVIFFQPIE